MIFRITTIIATGFLVAKGSVILSPSPALAAEGESFTWTCTYTGSETVSGFTWLLNGNTLATIILSPRCKPHSNPGPPDSTLYEYACISTSQATFTVKQISNMNNGNSWQCSVAVPGYIFSNNVTVTVQVSVNSVSLTPTTGSIRENVETTFTCETSTSRPAANITWYKESTTGQKQLVTSKVSSTAESVGDLEKSTSVLKYTPLRSDNRYKIYCQALNIPGRTPVMSQKFQMDVQYSPESAPYIQNYSNGSPYKVIENKQGMLACIIKGGNPVATLTWNCFDNGLSTEISGTTVTNTFTWSATRGTDRSCTCQSSHPVAGTQSVAVSVQVLYKPDRPTFIVKGTTISGPINFIDGKSRSVVCESNGKPKPDIYIWNKARSSSSARNTLTFTPVKKSDDGQYTCTANNTMVPSNGDTQIGNSSSTVKINVLYAPEITTLDDKDVVAGLSVNVQCPVIKGNPESTTFKWIRNGDSRSWDTQTLYIQNVTKNDDMMYTCIVNNTMRPTGSSQETGTDSGSFNLSVLYMASITSFVVKGTQSSSVTVDEKADVTLTCTVDSNPGSSIAIQLPDKMLQRKENAKALSYNHTGVKCLDTGVYTCTASNPHNNGKASEKKLNLFVRCYPRPLTQVKENVTSALRVQSSFIFKGLAYPIPTFTWLKKQDTTWKELSSNSHLSISITEVDTNLTITNVSQSDYGEYQLKIENEIDIFIQNYTLIPEGVPEAPSEFKVIEEHVSDTSVLLQWKPGFDGGPKQIFILMYKKTSDQKWMNKTVSDTNNNVMNYTLDNLASESEYQVVIFSQNKVGDSVGQNITFVTKVAESEPSNGNSALIGGAAGGGAGLVLILLIVGFITLRRRGFFTKGKAYREEENSDRKPVHSAEDDYGMQENPMYVSAGPRNQTTGGSGSTDAGAVYSTVDKERNKIDTNKNDVYAEVDKSKKTKKDLTDVYSSPVKPKGNKDKKEKKGFLKDKKNNKMTQDVDIYENATTTELKDTTAKQKKNDEIIYENPEPTKQAARKNVNKDGLIYADLTFNDQPKGQKKLVIHGLDDMTEYVQVDFTKKAEPLPDSDDDNNQPK